MPYRAYEPCSMSHAAWIFNQNLFSDVQSDERDRQEYANAGIRTISEIVAQQRAEQNNATQQQQQATQQQQQATQQQQHDGEDHVVISDENTDENADGNQPEPNESPALFASVHGSPNDGNGSRDDQDMTPNDLQQPEEPQNVEPQIIQGPDLW